jgi:hypothetical protein
MSPLLYSSSDKYTFPVLLRLNKVTEDIGDRYIFVLLSTVASIRDFGGFWRTSFYIIMHSTTNINLFIMLFDNWYTCYGECFEKIKKPKILSFSRTEKPDLCNLYFKNFDCFFSINLWKRY